LEDVVKFVNKIGFRTFGYSFGEMEVSELFIVADAADISTYGKLEAVKAQNTLSILQ
tara:strand:- start:84 stop:254 length:171 start_codon:yes stop_codon:yes gene_type:complete